MAGLYKQDHKKEDQIDSLAYRLQLCPQFTNQLFPELLQLMMKLLNGSLKRHSYIDRDDAYQVASLAILETIAIYDPHRGPFGAICNLQIHRRLLSYAKQQSRNSNKGLHIKPISQMNSQEMMANGVEQIGEAIYEDDFLERIHAKEVLSKLTRSDFSKLEWLVYQSELRGWEPKDAIDYLSKRGIVMNSKRYDNTFQRLRRKLRVLLSSHYPASDSIENTTIPQYSDEC